MKVLQVIEALTLGGAERLVVELTDELSRRGIDTKVLCLSKPGKWANELTRRGRYVGCVCKKRGADFAALRALKGEISKLRPDIVHSHLFTANLWTRLAALSKRDYGLVVTLHNVDSWRSPLHRAIDRILAPVADRYVAVSPAVRDYYARHGIPHGRLVAIPNGIRVNGLHTAEPFSAPTPLIRACGRLVAQKGFSFLVAAGALLAKRGWDFRMEIIGDGDERPRLEDAIAHAQTGDRVALVGPVDDARQLIAECDVFVLPSLREGLPLVLLEALLSGRPVVATRLPGLEGVVIDGENALVVEAGSAESLAHGLERLLAAPGEARNLGRCGRAIARREFSIERAAAAYAQLYEETLEERTK